MNSFGNRNGVALIKRFLLNLEIRPSYMQRSFHSWQSWASKRAAGLEMLVERLTGQLVEQLAEQQTEQMLRMLLLAPDMS